MSFFSMDGPFNRIGTQVFDFVALNLLWLALSIFSLGLLFPLATAALLYTVHHVIVQEDGYMFRTYVTFVKDNFKKFLPLNFFVLVALLLGIFNIITVSSPDAQYSFLLPVYLPIFYEIVIVSLYACAMFGEEPMKLRRSIKFAFIFANKHLFISLLSFFLILAFTLAAEFLPILLAFGVTPLIWVLVQLVLKRTLGKYDLSKLPQ